MSTPAPTLWLNGRQITGLAIDRAPVLCPVELTWGNSSALEQPDPANLKFTILFLDGMHDMPDLNNGGKIELIHPDGNRTIFAGTIRTMGAEPSTRVKGALEVTGNATDYTADLEQEYMATDLPAGTGRRAALINAFAAAGWTLSVPSDPRPSAAAVYNSIKLATMLDRFISRYRGRRYDTSYRDATGTLIKRVSVVEGSARSIPADTLIITPGGTWDRTYNTPSIDGVPSPIVRLPASNAFLDPKWSQDPENTITAVQLQTMQAGDDGFTTLRERNYKAAPGIVEQYGLRSVEVETDLLDTADFRPAAEAWMNNDSPWQMSDLPVRDSTELPARTLRELLDQTTRYKELLTVIDILLNRPDPGPSVMRSYLVGGSYTWTGKRWEISLALERTIYAVPSRQTTFTDLRNATNPAISTARLNTIGDKLTFADFREIEPPN